MTQYRNLTQCWHFLLDIKQIISVETISEIIDDRRLCRFGNYFLQKKDQFMNNAQIIGLMKEHVFVVAALKYH